MNEAHEKRGQKQGWKEELGLRRVRRRKPERRGNKAAGSSRGGLRTESKKQIYNYFIFFENDELRFGCVLPSCLLRIGAAPRVQPGDSAPGTLSTRQLRIE